VIDLTKLFCQAKRYLRMAFGGRIVIQFHQNSASNCAATFAKFTAQNLPNLFAIYQTLCAIYRLSFAKKLPNFLIEKAVQKC
jgi:hypothetical protein